LAENAQEFIFVHIPNKNTGDNPLRQKKIGRTTSFLGATPMLCGYLLEYSSDMKLTCLSLIKSLL
jgi:hypothetical protein